MIGLEMLRIYSAGEDWPSEIWVPTKRHNLIKAKFYDQAMSATLDGRTENQKKRLHLVPKVQQRLLEN